MNRRAFAQAATATGVAASTRSLWAQQSKPPVQIENHYLFLVRQPPVQRELELRPNQIQAVQAATDKVDGSLFLLRDVSEADRIQRSKPLIQQVQRELDPVLSRTQKQRLSQLVARAHGHRAVLFDEIANSLRFTASQRKRVQEIAQETEESKKELNQKLKQGSAQADIQKQMRDLAEDERDKFLGVFTAPQKRLISGVLGKPFEFDRQTPPKLKPPRIPLPGPWINSEPLTLEKLRGKVVALHFYAFA